MTVTSGKPLGFQWTYKIKCGSLAELTELSAGVTSVGTSWNDVVDQKYYHDGEGFAESNVTGGQLILKFSCDRVVGDAAQDAIADLQGKIGTDREGEFELTKPNGDTVTGECTVCNIEETGNDMDAVDTLNFEVHFKGKPTVA